MEYANFRYEKWDICQKRSKMGPKGSRIKFLEMDEGGIVKKSEARGASRIIKEKNDLPLRMFYHNATRPIEGISKETC